jgi:hypothetical protein
MNFKNDFECTSEVKVNNLVENLFAIAFLAGKTPQEFPYPLYLPSVSDF